MTDRAHVLGRLQAELRQAVGCFEHARAAELRAQIERMSAGTPDNPAKETTAARRPARSRNVAR